MIDGIKTLVLDISQELSQKHLTLAVAESCTGGGLAYWLTSVPGSSNWFDRGFITYSDQSKVDMLAVKKESIAKYGSVSREIAKEMAERVLTKSTTSLSLSITGIAGPSGGTASRPVGTVWIGLAKKGSTTEAH